MLIGYARVSKSDGSQLVDLQRDALIKAGVQEDHIYQDLASERKDDRPGLRNCLQALRPGDVLVVWKLDRLGRDLKHLVMLVDSLSKNGIGLKVLSGHGEQINVFTANGKLIFEILAEFERELIVERTKVGLSTARARGRLGGRPRKMDVSTIKMVMTALKDPSASISEIIKSLGINKSTLYLYFNGDGTPKETATRILNNH